MPFKLLSPKLQKLVEKKGFTEATAPQKMGIPEILKGKNVLILAKTGSGKTESVMLPIFDMILKNKNKPISALYINPLRSLSRDLLDRLFWWADKLDLDVAVRHGDTSQNERKMHAESPPDILITTPETLGSILIGKKLREHLKNVRYVVVDEIHEIVENKRGIQLSILLERLKKVSGNFQIIGLSATLGEPKKVAAFLDYETKIINAVSTKEYDIKVELPKPSISDLELSSRLFIGENTAARLLRLRELIKAHRSVLMFTNTRETAEILSSRFRKIDSELKHEVHHGSLSKESRIDSEKKFKSEEIKALFATSSLELGIDIGSIDLVVQYLSPRQVSKLIQRSGRAGHKVGQKSKCIILTDEEDVFESSVIARKAIKGEIEDIDIHNLALDVIASQIAGMALEYYDVSSNLMYEIIKNAYPYRDLTKEKFLEILKFLASLRIIFLNPSKDGDFLVRRSKKTWEFYYGNLSTIPDTKQLKIISIVENEPIGSLDEAFVAEHGESGNTFVVKGRAWKIIQVEGDRVTVEPVDDIESAIPAWEGELIPVPFSIAQEVGELRKLISQSSSHKEATKKILQKYNIDESSAEKMIKLIDEQKKFGVPDDKNFLMEAYKDFVILHSCSGTLINDTIGKYVSAIINAETGVAVNIKTDPYRIIFQTVAKPADIKRIIENASRIEDTLKASTENSSLFKHRFMQVAKRFGIISRGVRHDRLSIGKVIAHYTNSPAYEETIREIFLEKMDIAGAEKILSEIRKGNINLEIIKGLSYLGESGLIKQFSEVMKPRMPEKEIFEAFRRRLLFSTVKLVCTNCAEFSLNTTVKDIEERPSCPKCKSGLMAVTSKYKKKPESILKKFKDKKNLTSEEKKEYEELKRSASLMITYGKKYAIVQAGHGIGVETAARVLARQPKDEEALMKYIYEAEKNYAKTRIYWKA